MLIKNIIIKKRGEISIYLLVILVLLLTSISLTTFYLSSKKVLGEIYNAGITDKIELKKNYVLYYLDFFSKKSLIESYHEIISKEKNFDNVISMNNNLKDLFNNKLKKNFADFETEDYYLNELKNKIEKNEFIYEIDENAFSLDINNFKIEESINNIQIEKSSDLMWSKSLNEIGLENFTEIKKSKEICLNKKNVDEIKQCFEENLKKFEVKVFEEKDYTGKLIYKINFETKKIYMIDNEFKVISFNLFI